MENTGEAAEEEEMIEVNNKSLETVNVGGGPSSRYDNTSIPCSNKKKTSSSSKKRKTETSSSHRSYAVLPPGVINIIAESIGMSNVAEDILAGLAEDTSYKLRELISNCGILLKNNKRQKLLTEDVNRVLETSDNDPVYGHSAPDDCSFTFIEEASVFVDDDIEVDVVSSVSAESIFTQPKKQCINGSRVVLDPREFRSKDKDAGDSGASVPKASTSGGFPPSGEPQPTAGAAQQQQPHSLSAQTSAAPQGATTGDGHPPPSPQSQPAPPLGQQQQSVANKPPPELINYYKYVAKVILGGSTPLLKVALADVKSNPRVGPVCPYFLNLIALSVNKMPRHAWLTDALLSTVQAIVENQFVDPSCYLAVNRTVNSLLVIAIEPKVAKNCDDLLLRTRAAQLLAKVFICWNIEMKQQMDIVRQLLQLLLDKNISLQTHYGAIVSSISLGFRVLNYYFWPVMNRYIPILEEKQKTCSQADVAQVKGSILMAAEKMYRKEWNPNASAEESKRRLKLDMILYDYFGDALCPRRHEFARHCGSIYPRSPSSPFFTEGSTDLEGGDADGEGEGEDFLAYGGATMSDCTGLYDSGDFKSNNGSSSFVIQRSYLSYKVPYTFRKPAEIVQRDSVFTDSPEIVPAQKSTTIMFRFKKSSIGSTRTENAEEMARRRRRRSRQPLSESQPLYYSRTEHRFPTIWYGQSVYKNTRTIKYCVESHTKSPAGDLYTLL